MGVGSPGASSEHDLAWAHLRERGDFDVALLQETREPPEWVTEAGGSSVWRPKYAARGGRRALWGCAVVALAMSLQGVEADESLPWLQALPGSTAIARTPSQPVWFASVHLHAGRIPATVIERCPLDGIEVTTPDRSVWETNVVPHELRRLFGGETFLWGGDLNSEPRMDGIRGFLGGNQRTFEIYRQAGSFDAREPIHAEYQRTYFDPNRRAYQLDHVFVDAKTLRNVKDWQVDPEPATKPEPLSDHAPILVTLDDTGPIESRSAEPA